MDVDWLFLRSFFLSLILHGLLVALLVFSVDSTVRQVIKPVPQENIVKAVAVNEEQVEKELKHLKELEQEKLAAEKKKQADLERKLKDLENKAANVEKNRKAEEQKLADLQKKKVEETKKREEEQKKLEQLKQEKAELEKKQKEEAEKKRKQEQERKLKEEGERKRKEEEQRLQKELAEEQRQLEAAQKSRDQQLLQNIYASIYRRVVSNFNKSGLPEGLECVLSVRLVPGGEVVSVTISQSSGSDVFDRRALVAVQKASPLPDIPADIATFERLNLRKVGLRFKP